MYEELLTEIGMTKSEIAVYFALLDLGSSTTGPIVKKSGIASGKAYLVLDKLSLKGLVTHSIKGGVKYFQAKTPERIIDYLNEKKNSFEEKQKEIEKIIPKLKAKYDEEKYKPLTEVYEGVKGFRTFYEWVLTELENGDSIEVLGVSGKVLGSFDSYLKGWNKERIKKGIKMKIIYNDDARNFGKDREKLRLTEVKYMKKDLETPAWIVIFKDYVVTIDAHKDPICFLIKNKESAESYKRYFQVIWNQARE